MKGEHEPNEGPFGDSPTDLSQQHQTHLIGGFCLYTDPTQFKCIFAVLSDDFRSTSNVLLMHLSATLALNKELRVKIYEEVH